MRVAACIVAHESCWLTANDLVAAAKQSMMTDPEVIARVRRPGGEGGGEGVGVGGPVVVRRGLTFGGRIDMRGMLVILDGIIVDVVRGEEVALEDEGSFVPRIAPRSTPPPCERIAAAPLSAAWARRLRKE